jgi:hypothetical protein
MSSLLLYRSPCLATLTTLLLIYALAPLPAWLSLLIGLLIELLLFGLIIALGIATSR